MLARSICPSCARVLPQELSHSFCSQNLQLSSGIAFGSDCQMASRGLNLDSNLKSAAWPKGCKGFICSKVPKSTVWSLNSFKNAKIEDSCESISTLIHQTALSALDSWLECSNIKASVWQCESLSVYGQPQCHSNWLSGCLVSAPCWIWTHVACISSTQLKLFNHWVTDLYLCVKKNGIW